MFVGFLRFSFVLVYFRRCFQISLDLGFSQIFVDYRIAEVMAAKMTDPGRNIELY